MNKFFNNLFIYHSILLLWRFFKSHPVHNTAGDEDGSSSTRRVWRFCYCFRKYFCFVSWIFWNVVFKKAVNKRNKRYFLIISITICEFWVWLCIPIKISKLWLYQYPYNPITRKKNRSATLNPEKKRWVFLYLQSSFGQFMHLATVSLHSNQNIVFQRLTLFR